MKLLPKFMICENPMLSEDKRGEFILHTQEPEFLAVVLTEESPEQYLNLSYPMMEIAGYDHNDGLLTIYALAPIVQYTDGDIKPVMKAMKEWWCKYLPWEDRQGGKHGKVFDLKPISELYPDLRIITGEDEDKYMVIHKSRIRNVGNKTQLLEYLKENGIYELEGYINIFKKTTPGNN